MNDTTSDKTEQSDEYGTEIQHDFPFEEGNTVLVRARENGTSGNIVAKFEAECTGFREGVAGSSATARLELPFGTMNRVTIRSYEAEFEVVE